MRRVLLLCACLSLWCVAVASGATRYVAPAPAGSDTNDGSTGSPYLTIQKCATVSVSGDICAIRAGTYRETVTPPNNGVTFQPDGSASVTVSGADLAIGWTVHSGNIYKTTSLNLPLGVNNVVFVDGVMMNLARFPNTSFDLSHPVFAVVDNSIAPTDGSQVEDVDFGPYIFTDSALTQPNGFWVGAEITSMAGDHWSEAGVVTAYTTGRIEYDNLHQTQQRYDPSIHGGHYNYYLSNKLGALDTGGEWYYDNSITTLYLWTPNGDNPTSHVVEGKRRQWAFDLSGRSNITIRNLNIFAASVTMNSASSGNVLDGINVKYVWHQLRNLPAPAIGQTDAKWGGWMTGIILNGSNNILKNCTVAFSSHNGVYIHGTNNTVDNCTIHDVTYLKTEGGGVSWMGQDPGASNPGCSGPTVSNSTIYNTGNEGINAYYCPNLLVTHNDISHWGIQTIDNGCFYTSKGGTNGTISYNHCHDTEATGYRYGIYLDANPENYIVHHNVVWNVSYGIQVADPPINIQVYNNTVWNVAANAGIQGPGSGAQIRTYNNLVASGLYGADQQKNIEYGSNQPFVNPPSDFQLRPGTSPVDTGRSISGITTGCVGDCDVGAYEFGTPKWSVGATAVTPEPTCPANCTCTQTPGVCDPVANAFYVALTGLDTSPGTSALPFRTIQKCASVATSGQTCIIRAGIYRETVTPTSNGITFQPEGSDSVTVSGADLVTGWTGHTGNIYKSTGMNWDLGVNFNQVFVDGQAMNLARSPNASLDLTHTTWFRADSSLPNEQINTSTFEIFDSALTEPNGFWNGAEVTHMAPNVYSMAGTVTSYTTGHIVASNPHGDQSRFMEGHDGEQYEYYLSNKLGALDRDGEWYYDSGITTLYLWTPTNDSPATHTVEAKRRLYGFDLSNRSSITIKNLKLFATAINMNPSSSNNIIDGLDAKYVWHQLRNMPAAAIGQTDPKWGAWNTGIILAGTDNILKNCTIAWSSHNGVYLRNTRQTVENCTIHDTGYIPSESGAIAWMGDTPSGSSTTGHIARQNTIYNVGRYGILHYYAPNVLITNNLIYEFCVKAADCGATYTVKLGASGTISYNIVHDTHSLYFDFGIYLDDEANNWLVHHNVVWNAVDCGMVYKSTGFQIYNNTFNDTGTGICSQGGSGAQIFNNLGDAGIPSGGNNLQTSSAAYVNEGLHNYQLTAGSPAVDQGRSITGITTNCVGPCDIGAYEFGATPWTAGATTSPSCPVTCTCNVVPGQCDPVGGGLDPVAWWKLDEGTGTTANDSTLNARHGTVNGPIWIAGRIGPGALQFDGINDAVFLPAGVLQSMTSDQTVCLWAFTPNVTQPGNEGFRHTLLQLWQDASNGVRVVVTDDTTPPGLWAVSTTMGGTESSRQTTTQAFTNNTWVHLCYTREAGTFVLYTNGQAQPTSDPGGYSLGDSSYMGQRTATGGQFNGRLDQVKVWSRALSPADIQSEFTGATATSASAPHHRTVVR